MTWEEAYPIIAQEISESVTDRTRDVTHLKNALIAMADLTTIAEFATESQLSILKILSLSPPFVLEDIIVSTEGYGREAEVQLLYGMRNLYVNGQRYYEYSAVRSSFVENMNSFTVKYFGNLTSFVNSLNWEDGCIPRAWGDFAEEAHRDTSGWNLCSIS